VIDMDRALIVENYSDLLMMIAETLKQREYRCDAVQDCDQAIDLLKRNRYASILLDVTWPVTTNAVIRFLHEQQHSELKKVIIMTAFDPHYLGLDDLSELCTFLRKPFGIDDLLKRLEKCAPSVTRNAAPLDARADRTQ
jgi:DNA-binding response OmpR family regulator